MPNEEAPTISRNEVSKVLSKQVFGKKSDNEGKVFYAPVITLTDWDNDSKWVGMDNILGSINKSLRGIFAKIYLSNINPETGQLNEEAWAADAADFTAGMAKLDDLEEELDDLYALQQSYATNEAFGKTNADGALTEQAIELQNKITETAGKIKPLRAQKAQIEAKYAERAAKRAATKAANEAKKAAGVSEPVPA